MSENVPTAKVEHYQRRTSLLWLVPLVAFFAVVAVLGFQVGRAKGPTIRITFDDAAGLEPGADLVHRGISIGVVREVRLASDFSRVVVDAELAPYAGGIAREGAEFWVVQPEISLQRVAGLDTLIGPRYIEVRPGPGDARLMRTFEGLPAPPRLGTEQAGLALQIEMSSLGAIETGSDVLYRGIAVGSVRAVELAPDASSVIASVLIEPEHARLVRRNSRWWSTGGVGVDFGIFSGLSVQTGSLEQLIEGAISFATPNRPSDRVESGHRFELEDNVDEDWFDWSPSFPPEEPDRPAAS
ncbi:MAG: MlaD family protein [Planctomycetota bacterium]